MRWGAVWLSILAASAQEPAFQAGISIVEVDAQVIGKGGIIDGLQLRDFAVTDNGAPVGLRYCAQEEAPLDVALVFELSKVMAPKLPKLREAAEMALAGLRNGDRVAVLSYQDTVQVQYVLTGDLPRMKQQLRTGLAYASFARMPWVLPAVAGAAKYLAAQPKPHGRRVVLMFTGDAGSGLANQNHMAVARDLWAKDTILNAMVIPTALTHLSRAADPYLFFALLGAGFNFWDTVDDVAEQTGGGVIDSADDIRPLLRQMRKRYRLYYDMPAGRPGQRHRIGVELSGDARALHPEARISGRKGYVTPKN